MLLVIHTDPMWDETTVEKLTLVSEIDWLSVEAAAFIQPGETSWIDRRSLNIRAYDGSVQMVLRSPPRPDDRR